MRPIWRRCQARRSLLATRRIDISSTEIRRPRAGRQVDSRVRAGCRRRFHRGGAAVPIEDCMFKRVISAVIGTRHERERKKIQPIVDEINEQYARLHDVSEEELRGQTAKFREIIRERTRRARGARRRPQGAEARGERPGGTRSHRRGAEWRRRTRRRRRRAARGDRRGARRDSPRGVRDRARRRAPPASERRSWSRAAS